MKKKNELPEFTDVEPTLMRFYQATGEEGCLLRKVFDMPGSTGPVIQHEQYFKPGQWRKLCMSTFTPAPTPIEYKDFLYGYLLSSTDKSPLFRLPLFQPEEERNIAFLQLSARKLKRFYKDPKYNAVENDAI